MKSRKFVGYSQDKIKELNDKAIQEALATTKTTSIEIANNMVASGKYSKEQASKLMNVYITDLK